MLNRVFSKPTSKYVLIGVIVVIIVAAILIYFLVFVGQKMELELKASLSAKLEDSNIKSDETTYLLVGAKNTGTGMLEARLNVYADDSEAVKITYPNKELLSMKLLPDESVVRRFEVQGSSKAIRTDYEIFVEFVGVNDTIIDEETVLLTVRK